MADTRVKEPGDPVEEPGPFTCVTQTLNDSPNASVSQQIESCHRCCTYRTLYFPFSMVSQLNQQAEQAEFEESCNAMCELINLRY